MSDEYLRRLAVRVQTSSQINAGQCKGTGYRDKSLLIPYSEQMRHGWVADESRTGLHETPVVVVL